MTGPEGALHIERLGPEHDLSGFSCGNGDLDGWFRNHALAAQKADSARTFVLVEDDEVLGYFSLTMGSVRVDEVPKKLVRGLPRYPIGMVLLARLAIDHGRQGAGLGTQLLAEALRRALQAGEAAAARLVVVDAIDEGAADFYRRHGFLATADEPLRLHRRMKDIRASLDPTG